MSEELSDQKCLKLILWFSLSGPDKTSGSGQNDFNAANSWNEMIYKKLSKLFLLGISIIIVLKNKNKEIYIC